MLERSSRCPPPPRDICVVVRQSLDTDSTNQGVQDKVRDVSSNRASLEDRGPNTSDVGIVVGDYDDGELEEYLGAVRKGSRECYACSEQSYFAREHALSMLANKFRAGKESKREELLGWQWLRGPLGSHDPSRALGICSL